ncbi:MAG: nicotinamide-nucleotide adenylyltransferase [bacterium]
MRKILFIGRFQPFHLGHLSALQKIDERDDVDEIIVGVGSAQYYGTEDNPFSFEQRKQMIIEALIPELNKGFRIEAIDDVHDNSIWVEHAEKIVGKFDEVYTGNELVKSLFEEKKYQVNLINRKLDITATKIREMIKIGDNQWQKLVPKNIIKYASIG